MGNTPIFVADCLGIDISTIYRYRSLYLEGGLDKLLENRYRGYQGLLNIFQIESLKQELRTHLYTDAKQVSQWVKDTFEVTYTPQGMADLLNRIGFSYKKTTEVPCEADPLRQNKSLYHLLYKVALHVSKWSFHCVLPAIKIARVHVPFLKGRYCLLQLLVAALSAEKHSHQNQQGYASSGYPQRNCNTPYHYDSAIFL